MNHHLLNTPCTAERKPRRSRQTLLDPHQPIIILKRKPARPRGQKSASSNRNQEYSSVVNAESIESKSNDPIIPIPKPHLEEVNSTANMKIVAPEAPWLFRHWHTTQVAEESAEF